VPKQRYVSIFVKLLLIFFLVTIPLYIINLYNNKKGAENVKDEIAKSTIYQVSFYLRDFEQEVRRIAEMQARYIEDIDFLKISLLGETLGTDEQIRVLNGIRNKLILLQDTSEYIEKITMYIPAMNMTLDSTGYMQEYYLLDDMSKIFRGSDLMITKIDGSLFINQGASYVLSDREKISAYGISAKLSEASIRNSLLDFVQYKRSTVILLSHGDDWIILNSNDDILQNKPESFFDGQLEPGSLENVRNLTIDDQAYLSVYKTSPVLQSSLMVFIPENEILNYLKSYNHWLILISAVTVVVLIVFSLWMYRLMERPLVDLVQAFRRVEKGDMNFNIEHSGNDEFRYLYKRFNKMVNNLRNLIDRVYEQEIRTKNAELKQLQYQINPHFLYNSIFIIYRMTKRKDLATIEKLSRHLGEYYRFVTRSSSNEIELQKEVDHAGNYIEVQKVRFADRIHVNFGSIPAGWEEVIVPRLILQPIIENCYNHGLKNKEENGRIDISIYLEDGLVIRIDDNGEELTDSTLAHLQELLSNGEDKVENTGILNIHRRLVIFYEGKGGLSVDRSVMGGFSVRIRIPERRKE
jgi:two-component system sensor histidine kinase YesM